MSRIIARPSEHDLDSPGRRDYYVALEHDSTWSEHLIPLTVFVGPDAEPTNRLAVSTVTLAGSTSRILKVPTGTFVFVTVGFATSF